jgi:GNAT superfamily N-acetyltransferase
MAKPAQGEPRLEEADEGLGQTEVQVVPLAKGHKRSSFHCGNSKIDNFFKNNALKQHEKFQVRVFVTCDAETNEPLGFYSLCLTSLLPQQFDGEAEKFDRVKAVPCVYLAMIGVDKKSQGQGLGTRLLRDAFQRTLEIAENAGTFALTLHANDEQLAQFYANLGFERFEADGLHMYIVLPTMRGAVA